MSSGYMDKLMPMVDPSHWTLFQTTISGGNNLMLLRAAYLLILCAFAAPCVHAESRIAYDMTFANALFSEQDYYRAITEYKRIIHGTTNQAEALRARFMIGLSYYQGKKWDAAINDFTDFLFRDSNSDMQATAQLVIAESTYRKEDYMRAIDAFTTYIQTYPDDPLAIDAGMRVTQSYVQMDLLPYAEQQAENLVAMVLPDNDRVAAFAETIRSDEHFSSKSPLRAGVLAGIMPGAGYAYTGRVRDGMLAFILNAMTATAAAVAFHNDEPVAGTLASAITASWYIGNIYGSVNAAHKYNRDSRNRFIERIDFRYGVMSGLTDRLSAAGAISLSF
jgi:tetratricopeptide (TPR) repeat protein